MRRLHAAGVRFTVASSRPGAGMHHIVEALGGGPAVCAFNGGNIVEPDTGEVLSAHKLPRDAVATVLGRAGARRNRRVGFHRRPWYIDQSGGDYVALERRTVGYDGVVVKRFDDTGSGLVDKIVGSTKDAALLQRIESGIPGLRSRAGDAPRFTDLLPRHHEPLANKGEGVRELARLAGVALETWRCLGTWERRAMFDVAGFPLRWGSRRQTFNRTRLFVSARTMKTALRRSQSDSLRPARANAVRAEQRGMRRKTYA